MNLVLANAAFGDDPRRWPLPPATTPHELWLRAVAAGGQGRYGSAMADLAGMCRLQPGRPLVSLAHSTRASFLRQLGWHDRARRWDGRAMALAGSDPEAGADALIGLAADALGVARFAASAAALRRAGELLTRSVPPRLPVRLAWVSAELAMARGDGATAVGHAERAVELAGAFGSARHAAKSTGRAWLPTPHSTRPVTWESSRCAGRWRACWPTSAVPVTRRRRCTGFVTNPQLQCVTGAATWLSAD